VSMQKQTEEQTGRGTFGRRGVIAGAAALAGAILAKQAMEPVAAADGGNIIIGTVGNANNTYTTTTTLSGSPASAPGFRVMNNTSVAPDATRDAIQGYAAAAQNAGVLGRNDDTNGVGVAGVATSGTGVYGQSGTGSAVGGRATQAGAGLHGEAVGTPSSPGTVYGAFAQVSGNAPSNIAMYAANLSTTANSHGIVGLSTGGHGLVGTATNSNPVYAGLVGQGAGGANAGNFFGNAAVTGNLFVGGNQTVAGAKSAALAHPDGSHRLVYCVEAPESWLEDLGTGTLSGGKADVKLDPEFVAVADASNYLVFVTENNGTHNHLSVTNQTPSGFSVVADAEVASLKGKKSSDLNGTFSWRVVLRRKDIKANRLAKVDLPKLQAPQINAVAPKLPKQK
jgi:hypothetical protein